MGTSAPELVVSVTAALNDSAELALGNVVGSNIFNILAIVGCTAMVMPIAVGKGLMSKELPLVILSSLVMWAVASDTLLDGEAANVVSRIDGILLLAFFAIFMRYTFSIAKADSPDTEEIKPMPMWKAALWIIGGLAGLIFGGQYFVDGASGIARSLGVSESVIGLTLVAAGTSLPELATSVVAALKKNPGIAIGNVIGSCLFNVFFIIGTAATIAPLPLGGITQTDMLTLVGASVLLWFFGLVIGDRKITRVEGTFMVLCFIAYNAWLIINS
jgi:cation:H+ antiporter